MWLILLYEHLINASTQWNCNNLFQIYFISFLFEQCSYKQPTQLWPTRESVYSWNCIWKLKYFDYNETWWAQYLERSYHRLYAMKCFFSSESLHFINPEETMGHANMEWRLKISLLV